MKNLETNHNEVVEGTLHQLKWPRRGRIARSTLGKAATFIQDYRIPTSSPPEGTGKTWGMGRFTSFLPLPENLRSPGLSPWLTPVPIGVLLCLGLPSAIGVGQTRVLPSADCLWGTSKRRGFERHHS